MNGTTAGRSAAFILITLAALFIVQTASSAAPPREEIIRLEPVAPEDQQPEASPGGSDSTETTEIVLFPAQGINARAILSDLWFRHRALLERGEHAEAGRLVSAALAFMKREGIRTAPEIGAAFLAEGERALANGNYRLAQDNYRLAMDFDPTLAAAHVGLAVALLRGDRDLTGGLVETWRSAATLLADPESMFSLAGNAFLVIYLGLFCGSTFALLLLALRSAPAFFHDIAERFSGRLSLNTAHLLGWTILALPIVAPVSFGWVLAVWGAIVFAYLRGADRWAAGAALAMLLAAGPAGRLLAWNYGTAEDPTARALLQLVRTGPDLRKEEILTQIAIRQPRDPVYPFLLASAYRAGGRFDEAIDTYRRVLEIDPGNARAMVNLGNLYAMRNEFALAQNLYRRAWESDPTLALAHYNSHLSYQENFNLSAAEEQLRLARRVDEDLVNRILDRGVDTAARRTPLDTDQPAGPIWKRVFSARLPEGPWHELALALTSSSTLAGGLGLLTALLLPGLGLSRRGDASRRCRRCGRAFCSRCQVRSRYPDSCTQCVHLFVLRDGLAPNIRDRKMKEVMRYRRQRFVIVRIVSLALPGSGHVFGGRPIFGLVMLSAWCSAWIALALRGELLVAHGTAGAAGVPVAFAAALAVAFLAWLTANLSAHERARE